MYIALLPPKKIYKYIIVGREIKLNPPALFFLRIVVIIGTAAIIGKFIQYTYSIYLYMMHNKRINVCF